MAGIGCLVIATRLLSAIIMHDTRRLLLGSAALAALATLTASSARAQTGPDLLLGSFNDGSNVVLGGDGFFGAKTETDNDDEDVNLFIFNTSGRVKLDIDQFAPSLNINRAQPRAGYDFTLLSIDSDDPALPDQFSDTSIGFGMGIAAGEKWRAGLSVAVGHASADPFGDGNGWYGKADLLVGYDFNERESLGIVLDYNGNRTFLPDVPLPGILYTRKIDNDRYRITVGFPYSEITWRPDDSWILTFRYNIPDGGEANVEYKINEGLRVYASYQQQNDAFHWDELEDGRDRVIFSQSRAEIGLKGTYKENFSFLVAGGYAFDQEFEVGWDSRDTDTLAELDSAPYLRVGFELSF